MIMSRMTLYLLPIFSIPSFLGQTVKRNQNPMFDCFLRQIDQNCGDQSGYFRKESLRVRSIGKDKNNSIGHLHKPLRTIVFCTSSTIYAPPKCTGSTQEKLPNLHQLSPSCFLQSAQVKHQWGHQFWNTIALQIYLPSLQHWEQMQYSDRHDCSFDRKTRNGP